MTMIKAPNQRLILTNTIMAGILLMASVALAEGPRIKAAQESFDFGHAPQASEVSHVFWLRNTGDETLVVEKLITNCGCAQAPIDKNKVEPGDSTRVELIFGTGTFLGPVRKFAQIISNAVGRVPALTITADVFADSQSSAPLAFEPRFLDLESIRPEKSATGWIQHVTLRNSGKTALRVQAVAFPDRKVRLHPLEVTIPAGDAAQVTLEFDPELPEQIWSKSATFTVPDQPEIRVTLPIFKKAAWENSSPHAGE